MEMRCKGLFLVCLILGLQIHLPVTMFPANPDMNATTYESKLITDVRDEYLHSGIIAIPPHVDANEGPLTQQTTGVREYNIPAFPTGNQIKHDGLNKSPAKEHIPMNDGANQARLQDLPDFKRAPDLNGLGRDLGATNTESSKSDISPLPTDLLNIKLEKIQEELNNLSANLSNKRHIIRADNGGDRSTVDDIGTKLSAVQSEQRDETARLRTANTNVGNSSKYFNSTSMANQNNTHKTFDRRQIVDGPYWSGDLELKCPSIFTDTNHKNWKRNIDQNHVIKVEPGCGSMQNRLVTFNDSTKACARYRLNSDLMQGDIYSYYLGRLLGVNYTPPTSMAEMDSGSRLWENVQEEVRESKWSEGRPVILSKWVDALRHVYMPNELKDRGARLQLENYRLSDRSNEQLCGLVQWSDLMVFDYISANLDRVVNNMFNLKWNPRMLEKPIHNLEQLPNGQFVFLDNESGLFHGYRLLDTYESYLKDLLQSVCIFRKSTVSAIERLFKSGNTGGLLQKVYEQHEPNHAILPRMSETNKRTLRDRVANVYKHMQLCKHDINQNKS